jgi:hypothetical protein
MTPEDVKQAFVGLQYKRDGRNPPDERRRGNFRTGWEDATKRSKDYVDGSLDRLTWHNLGYRLGKHFGDQKREEIDKAYDLLAVMHGWSRSNSRVVLPGKSTDSTTSVDDSARPKWFFGPQYWVVGAMWGGHDDKFDECIREGYWLLGWSDEDKPSLAARRDRIRLRDFIAIKKISSPSTHIEIRAIGSVTKIDPKNKRIHVRWMVSDLHNLVLSRGCYDSIRGPFDPSDEWTQGVFQLDHREHIVRGAHLPDIDQELLLAKEGAKRWRRHLVIERNRNNVERKKAQVKCEKGSLECEVCHSISRRFTEISGQTSARFTTRCLSLRSTDRYASRLMTWQSSVPTATG